MFQVRGQESRTVSPTIVVAAAWVLGAACICATYACTQDPLFCCVLALVILSSSVFTALGLAALSWAAVFGLSLGAQLDTVQDLVVLAEATWCTVSYTVKRFDPSQCTGLLPASWLHARSASLRKLCLIGGLALLAALIVRDTPVLRLSAGAYLLFLTRYSAPKPAWRPRASLKLFLANAALLLFSTLVSFGAVEYGVRHFTTVTHGDFYLVPDPDSDFTLRRNAHVVVYFAQEGAPPKPVELNSSEQGLRDDWCGPKKDSEYRILMLGDSYTMGWGLEQDETYERQLNAMLPESVAGRPVRVINAGVGGFAPWQERVFLRKRCLALQPDLVILQIYPENDLPDTLSHNGQYLRSVSLPEIRNVQILLHYDRFPYRLEYWLRNRCYAYRHFVFTFWKAPLVAESLMRCRFYPENATPSLPRPAKRLPQAEPDLRESYEALDRAYALMESDILGIQQDCHANGIDMIAFTLPCPLDVYDEAWETVENKEKYIRFNDIYRTEGQFQRDGVPYVPMLGALQQRLAFENVFLLDGHLNAAGANVVAEQLRDYLVRECFPSNGAIAAPGAGDSQKPPSGSEAPH